MDSWIDELERDLGRGARLRLIATFGGQRRDVPSMAGIEGSVLARETGEDVAYWLSDRFGGTRLEIPTLRGSEDRSRGARLRAAILEAGLEHPTRSANEIAAEHGVSARWVIALRTEMGLEREIQPELPLFDRRDG